MRAMLVCLVLLVAWKREDGASPDNPKPKKARRGAREASCEARGLQPRRQQARETRQGEGAARRRLRVEGRLQGREEERAVQLRSLHV